METFQMVSNSIVKIAVKISTDASVGSYVRMGNNFKKRSTQYNFNITIGNSNDLRNEIVSEVSNFFTSSELIENIMNSTSVVCTISDSSNSQEYTGTIERMTDRIFVHYLDVQLI